MAFVDEMVNRSFNCGNNQNTEFIIIRTPKTEIKGDKKGTGKYNVMTRSTVQLTYIIAFMSRIFVKIIREGER